jgi:hypothetical protein
MSAQATDVIERRARTCHRREAGRHVQELSQFRRSFFLLQILQLAFSSIKYCRDEEDAKSSSTLHPGSQIAVWRW